MTTYNAQSHVNIGDLYTASMHNTLLDNVHALWTNAASGAMPYWSAANVMAALLKPAGQALMTHNGTIPSWLLKGNLQEFLVVDGLGSMGWYSLASRMQNTPLVTGQAANDLFAGETGSKIKRIAIGTEGDSLQIVSGVPAWGAPDVIHAIGTIDNYGTTQGTTSTSLVDVTGATVNLTLARACKIIVIGMMSGYTSDNTGSYPIRFGLSIDGTEIDKFVSYSPYAAPVTIAGYKASVAAGTRTVKLRFRSPYGVSVTSFGGYLTVMAVPD